MTTTKRIHRELASPAEIAALFRLDIKTVRRRIADGTLPAFRVGRQIRIDVASAEAALMRPMNAAAVAMIRAEAGRRTS
ncbi:helix-turn-helix domain-containing protein [Tessaracoccus sp. MC1627]|uniref:helix-turn-helix domain-containing protein n=1 Tax=Tessaracoccus sp. MC1627 TaxID=2760312 RepID=UPI001603D7C7|nr:helix-turn-helix domain-containing protein [Tessaracoccus sp. MC1627]MBB1512773.1 helix-turn-helix domain-containing protein [Tessaracoccus sp. MC1627]